MIISVTSLKGGVGKSTIAQNLAVCLAHNGVNVCIADADPDNENSGNWGNIRSDDSTLVHVPVWTTPELTLSRQVKDYNKQFDVVIIDGTPSIGQMTSKILYVADVVLVPTIPSINDLWALSPFLKRHQQAQEEKEQEIPLFMIMNQFKPNVLSNIESRDTLKNNGFKVLENFIRDRDAYRSAVIQGKGVIEYTDDKAKKEFINLYNEILPFIKN
ncbi:MAG: AAA family ATPase [Emticicia sp.]|nr:AAA family ATPase [Emticicia sp.]